jgi:phosphoglycerate dehydrogenase-like enzyme
MDKVLVIDPALAPFVDRLAASLPQSITIDIVDDFSDEDLARRAADATIFIDARRRIDGSTLAMAPNLRFIQFMGVGFDPVDRAAAASAGVAVAYMPGVNRIGAAEHTVMLMLALLKRVALTEAMTRAGRFVPGDIIVAGIDDLADATVGLLGLGQIGSAVAERLAPFGTTIVYHTRQPVADAERRLGASHVSFEELLRRSTILSLHLPLSAETHHLIGATELASMPPGSYLVNVGRGGLVDEAALREAITSGHLAGAGLDVVEGEIEGINPFADLPQVIVSPHVAGGSGNSMRNVVERCTDNINRYLAGEPLRDLLPAPTD